MRFEPKNPMSKSRQPNVGRDSSLRTVTIRWIVYLFTKLQLSGVPGVSDCSSERCLLSELKVALETMSRHIWQKAAVSQSHSIRRA
jgi:hypothetical protein